MFVRRMSYTPQQRRMYYLLRYLIFSVMFFDITRYVLLKEVFGLRRNNSETAGTLGSFTTHAQPNSPCFWCMSGITRSEENNPNCLSWGYLTNAYLQKGLP